MREVLKKFAALILAAAMMVTFTPLYGAWGLAYAEGEEDGEWDFPVFGLEQVGDGPCRVFSDGQITFRIPEEAIICDENVVDIKPFVGIPGPDGWDSLGDEIFSYDPNLHEITIFGNKIEDMFPPENGAPDHIGVSFEATDADGNIKWMAGINNLEFWYAEVSDFLPEDRILLPGWDGSIDGTLWARVWNSEYPDGEDFPIDVYDVHCIEGEELLEEWHPDSDGDNHWYYYRAGRNYGRVTFRIFYTDIHGENQTHDMHVDIASDVYESDLWSDGNVYKALPGGEIYLNAWANHKYMAGDWEKETEEGLEFVWSLERGEDIAEIIPDVNDHSRARLVFKDLGPDEEGRWEGCRVRMAVVDLADGEEKAVQTRWYNCFSDFYEIYPSELNMGLSIGQSTGDQNLELRHYKYDGSPEDGYNAEKYKTVNVRSAWFDFDENALEVYSNGRKVYSGQEIYDAENFSVTRIREWGTDLHIRAKFINDYGDEEEIDRNHWFRDLNYDVWIDSEGDRVYDDSEWTAYIRTHEDLDYSNVDIRYEVRGFRYDENQDEDVEVDVPNECYSIAPDNMSITFIGEKMAKWKVNSIELRVETFYKGEGLGRWDERRFWLEDSCTSRGEEHLWLSLPTYTDCTSEGILREICWNCGERRVTVVPPKGHTAKAVKAVASTASKEGNIAYWKCADCGKYFTDAKCTKETDADSVITPKGIAISKVTAQSKGFTVTWKKPASPYIDHTTGYEIMYALNSKFTSGKKTVTVANPATASKKITKLKAKKKYYIKMRTYRTIGGKKYYSPWSKVKTTTTK